MAEEKKYTILNGNDWATNNILEEDPLRILDLSNDTQIITDLVTGNLDGEKQRAAKNFEHMMGVSGYPLKEVAFNTITNVAPDLVLGGLGKVLYRGGKAALKKGIDKIIDAKKLKKIKTSKINKEILDTLKEAKKADKKYFQNNQAIKNINKQGLEQAKEADELGAFIKAYEANEKSKSEALRKFYEEAKKQQLSRRDILKQGDENAYNLIKDRVIAANADTAPDDTIIKFNVGIRGKNDYADVLLEPFLKEDDYLKNITHDNAKFLLGNAGERLSESKGLENTIKVTDDIMKNSNQTGIFQDVVRANNDAFARNSKRIEEAYKSGKIGINKKWELDQLNKINYYNASSRIINDTLIKESVIKNPIKLFGKIPLGKEKVKTTYISDFDMVRPFKHMPKGSKAKDFWAYWDLAKEAGKTLKKPAKYTGLRAAGKAITTGVSKTADNILLPMMADIVHADMDNPNRYNEADIMDAWELIKRDNAAGLLKDRGGKPLVIPENPTVREIIDFIKRGTPEADKKRWYEEIQNSRINRLKEEYMDPEFIKEYNIDKMSNKELIDFLSNSSLVDDNDREEIKNNYNLFIKKPKEEK